ncbi:MAG: CBS domain-containing protein [Alphaproteobacteria bacterium]
MNARDLMNRDVVKVAPDTPLREVAKTLINHGISAVPVVDDTGTLVGMVSEGDLVGRKKTERETSSEWWLMRLAEGEPLSGEFLDHLQSPLAVAREVMSTPVITVTEETRMDEIASLMAAHRVKRVPVLRDGSIVGIVRRADLLRTIGGGLSAPVSRPPEPRSGPTAWIDQLDGERPAKRLPGQAAPAVAVPRDADLTVDDFQHLVVHHREELDAERARQHAEAVAQRRRDLRRLIDTHITDKEWNVLLHGAREAAERGETEFLLLRFPSQLCSDGGRAINAPDPEWPATLRGEAAELYLRWERELRPRRFHLAARVVEFPDGVPGDIGLFLTWPG